MPSILGGDNMSENYAPGAYLCGHFVGFESTVSRWRNGYRYTFGLSGDKLICARSRSSKDDGKEVPFCGVPSDVLEGVLRVDPEKGHVGGAEYRQKVLEVIERKLKARRRKT